MNDRLTAEIERIRSITSISSLDEANVKMGVILPVLQALGWNPFDIEEVKPEHSVGGGNVDYSLRLDGDDRVFVEVKRPRENLKVHQEQLLRYAFAQGVPIAVLTNGLDWWFYLPSGGGTWEERRFSVIELHNPDVSQAVDGLIDFLSKENVRSGFAVGYAEGILGKLWQDKRIEEALPRAWDQLVTDPDNQLLAMLNQKVMELCGFEASLDQIKRFLVNLPKPVPTPRILTSPLTPSQPSVQGLGDQRTHKHGKTSPVSFTFCGERVEVKYWSHVLVRLGEAVYKRHGGDFSKVHTLGSWHPVGQSSPNNRPKPIADSGWIVNTNRPATEIVSMCHHLLSLFGYSPDDLQIETT